MRLTAPHMASLNRLATAIAIAGYLPLITLIMLIAEARELRPSNHGLEFQVTPPTGQKSPPEMVSFFGNKSSSSTPVNVAQPRAMNSSDSSWWESGSGSGSGSGRGSGGGDRLRHVLLVASLVCGGAGAALLVAAAFVHLYRYQKRRSSSSSNPDNNAIVIRK